MHVGIEHHVRSCLLLYVNYVLQYVNGNAVSNIEMILGYDANIGLIYYGPKWSWAEMVMGRNGHGPKWLWAEIELKCR